MSRGMTFSGMFWDASAFNSDLSQWNVLGGLDFSYMFYDASSFSINLCDWSIDGNVYNMFKNSACPNVMEPTDANACYDCYSRPSAYPSQSVSPTKKTAPTVLPTKKSTKRTRG